MLEIAFGYLLEVIPVILGVFLLKLFGLDTQADKLKSKIAKHEHKVKKEAVKLEKDLNKLDEMKNEVK